MTSGAQAATWYVRKIGNDNNNGTTANLAFLTIGKAVSQAKLGDDIWVGAGDYAEYFYVGAASNNGSKLPLAIRADLDGAQTGDKGSVVVRAPNTYAMSMGIAGTLHLEGITFAPPIGNTGNAYGPRAYVADATLSFNNCRFEGLYISAYAYNGAACVVSGCSFQDDTFGVYVRNAPSAKIDGSSFHDVTYGMYVVDSLNVYASGCKFGADTKLSAHRPITGYRSAVTVTGSHFDSPSYGVYGTEYTLLDIDSCTVNEPLYYGIYGTGENLSANQVTVIGTGNRIGTGVMLGDLSGGRAVLQDVEVDGTNYGVMVLYGDYDFQGTKVSNTHIGLYCHPYKHDMILDSSAKIELTKNYVAFYSYHYADTPGTVEVRDRTFSDNDIGLLSYNDYLTLDGCHFDQNGYGASIRLGKQTTIRDCSFSDNMTRDDMSRYGLYLESDRISIRDTVADRNYYGIYIKNTTTNQPELKNVSLDGNEHVSLYMYNGNWTWTGSDNVVATNGKYGVYANNVDWNVNDVTLDGTCLYPCVDVYGNLSVSNSTVSGSTYGFYGYRSESLNIADSTITGVLHYGIRAHECESIQIDGVDSSANNHSGLYCYSLKDVPISVTNSTFSDNVYYGILLNGLALPDDSPSNLTINGNRYGISVHNHDFVLNTPMNLSLENNTYATMCYYAKMTARDITLRGNGTSVYSYRGSLDLTGSNLSSENYGVIAYPVGDVSIDNCVATDATYGIYVAPFEDHSQQISVTNTELTDNSHIGLYLRSYSGSKPKADVSDLTVQNSRYGFYTYESEINATDCEIDNSTSYGIAQIYGSGTYTGMKVESSGSWSVVAYGDDFVMKDSRVIGPGYGILLYSDSGSVINSVVRDTSFGIRLDKEDAQFSILQTTVGNIQYYGIWHRNGNTTLRNSVVDADYYALWNQTGNGTLTNDHNLIHADRQAFVGTTPGDGDIEKDPIFLDPAKGDLHLAAGSPAINAGTDLSAVVVADIEGNERPSYRQFEMGAFEFTDAAGSLRVLDWDEKAK